MTRNIFIERLRRQVYGSFPVDEADITDELINQWVNDGIGLAAKKNYTDNLQLEGVAFLNNSFYTTFKGLAITRDEQFLWKLVKDSENNISFPVIVLSENQIGLQRSMRPIPNKVLGYPESVYFYFITPIIMSEYSAMITMVSGGDSTDLNSSLNVPDDYIPVIVQYVQQQLMIERQQPVDAANDGQSAVKTT